MSNRRLSLVSALLLQLGMVSVAPCLAQDSMTKTFTLTGQQPGGFNIHALVQGKPQTVPMQPANNQTPTAMFNKMSPMDNCPLGAPKPPDPPKQPNDIDNGDIGAIGGFLTGKDPKDIQNGLDVLDGVNKIKSGLTPPGPLGPAPVSIPIPPVPPVTPPPAAAPAVGHQPSIWKPRKGAYIMGENVENGIINRVWSDGTITKVPLGHQGPEQKVGTLFGP